MSRRGFEFINDWNKNHSSQPNYDDAIDWADKHPKSPWRSVTEEPKDKENILCYYWYDGPHYFQGYYIAESKEIEYELPEDGKCFFDSLDKWMPIPKFEEEGI